MITLERSMDTMESLPHYMVYYKFYIPVLVQEFQSHSHTMEMYDGTLSQVQGQYIQLESLQFQPCYVTYC